MADHPRSSSTNNINSHDRNSSSSSSSSSSHVKDEDGRVVKRPRRLAEDATTDNNNLVVPSPPPPQLAQKEENDAIPPSEVDEAALLSSSWLLQPGQQNAFVSVEERERQVAQERRRQRQERLQKLRQQQQAEQQQQQQQAQPLNAVETTTISVSATATTGSPNVATTVLASENAPNEVVPSASMDPDNNDHDDDDDDDDFDMFSSPIANIAPLDSTSGATAAIAAIAATTTTNTTTQQQQQQQQPQQRAGGVGQQDWDDAEGYYKAVIGEIIHLDPTGGSNNSNSNNDSNNDSTNSAITLRVAGLIGKGVFSAVLQCTTLSNSTSIALPPVTAVKFIRNNETMARAAVTEIQILQRLKGAPGIVPMLLPTTTSNNDGTTSTSPLLEHRGHTILVFNFMQYNLRDVLQKFGKGVGLSLPAVRSYFGQLLAAATHLQKHGILHLDLKPDNILVSADFGSAQLADFGSAVDVQQNAELVSTPAPYLVSRFYRAPELILGLIPIRHAVDLWSLAVTVAELFLGNVLFRGTSNNDMLYVMQQHLGPCPNRMIRQHLVQCQKYGTATQQQHFRAAGSGAAYCFLQQTTDPVTGTSVHRELSLVVVSSSHSSFPGATPLHPKLLKAQSAKDGRRMVQLFSDLLQQCLVLDPTKRIALKDALRHEFFQPPRANNNNSSSSRARTTTTTTTTSES